MRLSFPFYIHVHTHGRTHTHTRTQPGVITDIVIMKADREVHPGVHACGFRFHFTHVHRDKHTPTHKHNEDTTRCNNRYSEIPLISGRDVETTLVMFSPYNVTCVYLHTLQPQSFS